MSLTSSQHGVQEEDRDENGGDPRGKGHERSGEAGRGLVHPEAWATAAAVFAKAGGGGARLVSRAAAKTAPASRTVSMLIARRRSTAAQRPLAGLSGAATSPGFVRSRLTAPSNIAATRMPIFTR